MLIVCNGAPKSGSTWLYNIVVRLRKLDWPDRKYLTGSKTHPTIRPELLQEFLDKEEYSTRDLITKTHYGRIRQRDLLLSRPQARVLDMKRDLYDVIVSTYYDWRLRHGFAADFKTFYWFEGRTLAEFLIKYHQVWGDGHPQVYVTSFEALKTDFAREARRIADFLGVSPTDREIAELEQETSIDSLREQYKDDPRHAAREGGRPEEQFFRKGVIGDWKNHFDDRMLRDISEIEKHGIRRFDVVELTNKAKRYLYSVFPALSPYRKPAPHDSERTA
jgi:hypothetical protein